MAEAKWEIMQYLDQSRDVRNLIQQEALKEFTTIQIAASLHISRGLASQYLNELYKENRLVKIQSKPVYYFSLHQLEINYQLDFKHKLFMSVEEFKAFLHTEHQQASDFRAAIGYDSSLAHALTQCKTALEYSDHGIPLLLYGEKGTGKTFLSVLLFEYALKHRLLPADSFMALVQGKTFQEDNRCLTVKIFDSRLKVERKEMSIDDLYMLIKEPCIVFFDDVEYLGSKQRQEQIIIDMMMNTFDTSAAYLVFTTSVISNEYLSENIVRKIPVIIELPLLKNRSVSEKKQFLKSILLKETKRAKEQIRISSSALNAIIAGIYTSNIHDFIKAIQYSCAFSVKQGKDKIISVMSLPNDILQNLDLPYTNEDWSQSLLPEDIRIDEFAIEYQTLLRQLCQSYTAIVKIDEAICKEWYIRYLEFADFLMYEQNYSNEKIDILNDMLHDLFQKQEARHTIVIPSSFSLLFARYLYLKETVGISMDTNMEKHMRLVETMLEQTASQYPNQIFLAKDTVSRLELVLNLKMDAMDLMILFVNFHHYNRNMLINRSLSFIICHGYSTASSIADVTNTIIGQKIFNAIDIPIDSNAQDISHKLYKFISQHQKRQYDKIVILIDMGSLKAVAQSLRNLLDVTVCMISNVSTGIALEVGLQIKNHTFQPAEIKRLCNQVRCEFMELEGARKQDTILFVSENENDGTDQILALFKKSMPYDTNIEISSCDIRVVTDPQQWEDIQSRHNILFISGLNTTCCKDAPFIPIEKIISKEALEKIKILLKPVMETSMIDEFQSNLAKYCSLENIMESITFLDPNKLFELVQDSVQNLELNLCRKFEFGTRVGLYIHVSCLIERLVTKQEVSYHLSENKEVDAVFRKKIRDSFYNVTNVFGVELPQSEIAYIYEYIHIS